MLELVLAFQLGTHYVCKGTADDGPYKVNLEVKAHEDSYIFYWSNGTVGIGILDGDNLSVSFFGPTPVLGVLRYKVSKKSLKGVWSTGGKLFTEECEKSFGVPTGVARR